MKNAATLIGSVVLALTVVRPPLHAVGADTARARTAGLCGAAGDRRQHEYQHAHATCPRQLHARRAWRPSLLRKGKQPPDLTDGRWDHGSTDGEIFTVIKRGLPPTMMAGYDGRIPDGDIWSIVNYLRTLSPKR